MRDPSRGLSEEELEDFRAPALPDQPARPDRFDGSDEPDEPDEPDLRGGSVPGVPRSIRARRAMRRSTRATQHWARLIHVYASMVCFLVVLFFAVTGVTLNHPTWSIGGESTRRTTGTLPSDWKHGSTIDWLRVDEYLRAEHSLRGTVNGHNENIVQASIEWKGPGYVADAFINVKTGTYNLSVESAGLLAMMNDLHKGRDTGARWKWLIDVAGVFLAVVSMSGIILQLVLRKRRRAAVVTATVGGLVAVALALMAVF